MIEAIQIGLGAGAFLFALAALAWVGDMRPAAKVEPPTDPVLDLPIDEQIEARVEQRQAARQSANALEAERLDRQLADLYAAKRREGA
jgi:hypothetical protein